MTFATTKVISGNRLMPAAGDAYLARTGYEGQMVDGEATLDRPDNLFEPVPGEVDAHGRFDDRARRHSVQEWLRRHRTLALLGAGAIGVAVAARRRTH